MTAVFSTVVDMSIKGGVVILAVLLMRFLLLKAPKKFSYLLWSVAAFRLCVPVSFQAVFSIFSLRKSEVAAPVTPPAVIPGTPVVNTPPLTVPSAPVVTPPATPPTTPVPPPVVEAVPTPTLPVDTAVTPAEAINWESLLSTAFAVLWLAGLAAMVAYGVVSYVKLYRRMQNAVRLEGNVYASDRISSPFTLGFLKPRIYLPFGLDEREQAHIIAHERHHIKRLDHIVKPFAYLLLAVHWFNPLCWLAFNRMSMDMEMSCDEAILRRMSEPGSKAQYTETLLSVASANRFPAPSPLAFSDGGGAKQRIKHALNWKKPKVWVTALACMLCLVTLVACAADKVVPKNAPETETPPVSESTAEYYTLPFTLSTVSDEFMAVSDLAYIYNDEEGSGWNLRLMFHHAVTRLQFIEVEESEETTAGKVLYEKESFAAGDALHITTYLNDTAANRGLSFLDVWGQRRYYTIEVSMKDGSLSLKEFGTQRARLKNRILAEGEAEEADAFEMDVTFDGQPDLLIEKKPTPPTGLWFDTYVWVEEENSYCHAEGWDLANFAVDQENKRILSHDSGDMRVFHTISYWDAETRQPVVEHQLLWGWRATDETQSEVEFWEYKNGDELVASYTVPAEEWGYVYTLNQEDSRFAPYFEPGSLWDLNGEKWRDFPLAREFYDMPLVAKLSGVQGDYTSPSLPAELTAEAIRADLEQRTDLIPFEAALGGTNYFSGIHILSGQYVYATAGDDHHYENLLLQYYKTPEGSLQWALLGRYQWNGHSYYPMMRITADKTPVAEDFSRALTAQELTELETFLNDKANNGLISSLNLYTRPEEISLYFALSEGAGIGRFHTELEETQRQAVVNAPGYTEFAPCLVFRGADIKAYLQTKLGVSLADLSGGTAELDYVEEYDLYFLQHTDYNGCTVDVTAGEIDKNGHYVVAYTAHEPGKLYVVTLRKTAEGYQFVSNLEVDRHAETADFLYGTWEVKELLCFGLSWNDASEYPTGQDVIGNRLILQKERFSSMGFTKYPVYQAEFADPNYIIANEFDDTDEFFRVYKVDLPGLERGDTVTVIHLEESETHASVPLSLYMVNHERLILCLEASYFELTRVE